MLLPSSHRVVSCQGGAETVLERRPLSPPGAREVLLRMRVVGLCGTDLFKLQTGAATPGTVLGHELVGEVVAVGEKFARFAPGDRVAVPHHVACGSCLLCRRGNDTMCPSFKENLLSPGGFAEHVLVRARAAAEAARLVPDALADDAAVFMEPAACVLRGVRRAQLDAGALTVIQGAGSMGLLHLLVLRAALPEVEILVIDPLEARRHLATGLGATAVAPPGPEAHAALGGLGGGHAADAVFDTVGGAAATTSAVALTRHGGTIVLFAHAPAGECAAFELNDLFKHEQRILGTYSGGLDEQAEVFRLMIEGRLDPTPLVSHRLPLDAFATGVELARRREALKVVFTAGDGSAGCG